MATGTAYYNLTKPASNENYNLATWNTNLDMIDAQMHQNETETFTGATSLADGTVGNVPAPTIADKDKYLKGDGTWDTPSGGGSGDITDLDFSNLTSEQTGDIMDKLNRGTSSDVSGTFTTHSQRYGKVEVDCGFEPSYIEVHMPFLNMDSVAIYDASVSTTYSTWYEPTQQVTYQVQLGESEGGVGISDITSTGFKYRSDSSASRNQTSTYTASGGSISYIQTVDFSELTASQIADLKAALGIS